MQRVLLNKRRRFQRLRELFDSGGSAEHALRVASSANCRAMIATSGLDIGWFCLAAPLRKPSLKALPMPAQRLHLCWLLAIDGVKSQYNRLE